MKIYIILFGILISFSLYSQEKSEKKNTKEKLNYSFEKKEKSGLKIISKEEFKNSNEKKKEKKSSIIKNKATEPKKKK